MKLYRFQYDVSQWGSFETRYSEEFPRGPWVHSIEELGVFLPSELERKAAESYERGRVDAFGHVLAALPLSRILSHGATIKDMLTYLKEACRSHEEAPALKARIAELEQAAKYLRTCQKAYMAARGNEELGKAVGDAASRLDELLAHRKQGGRS